MFDFSSCSRRDTARVLIAPVLASLAGCAEKKKAEAPAKQYPMTGEVIRLDPQQQTATIKHETIGDWMEAMTMEFPIRDKAEFAKLVVGKRIKATVHVRELDYWITGIEVQ